MEQKKKRGRPKTENPRSRQVGVWMNDAEYQQFLAVGGCAGVRKLLAQAAKEKGLRVETRKPLTNNQKAE